MSAVNEELNMKVYEKLFDEQEKFKEWLLTQPPEEILNHAYEYTVRQDIVLAMEYHDLSDDQCRALLSSPAPLDEIYHDFEQIEGDHMDVIRGCIETRANHIIEAQAEALRVLPVYAETAAYAREHGERDLHQQSMNANVMCRTAIEDAIHDHYKDNRLCPDGAMDVLKRFGAERTSIKLPGESIPQTASITRISRRSSVLRKSCGRSQTLFCQASPPSTDAATTLLSFCIGGRM